MQPTRDLRTLIILVFSATAGVLVEYYDFYIYGYAAAVAFPAIFFPKLPPTQGLVFSYLAFGAGFPARLLGAFIFGHFGDRAGRKHSFLISIVMMGAATCATGLLPGYAKLGVAAPILLVTCRVLQGIGLGGEFGGASSLLAEFGANRPGRAFWTSMANLGIPLGGVAASGMLLVMSRSFATSGWRIAMLSSVVIVVPALVARHKLADSPLFSRLQERERIAVMPSFAVFKKHVGPIVLLALVIAFSHMDSYVTGTYLISFMRLAGIPLATTAAMLMLSRVGDVLGIIVSGPVADLLKRRMTAYLTIGLATVLSYPFVVAILSKHIFFVMLLQMLISFFGIGIMHGLAPILASETFPTKFRYSGAGISYNLAGVLGGMIAPSLLAGFIGQDVFHNGYLVPVVYAVYCAVAMVALVPIRETKDLKLADLDEVP